MTPKKTWLNVANCSGDQAQKQIALFNCVQAILERAPGRDHRHGALMRHPDFIAKAGQNGIDALQQLLDAVHR